MIERPVHLGVSDDLRAVRAALGGAARVLTVSAHGAGEAALCLAAAGADEVVAMDLEAPGTLAEIVELKRAAFALLGREDALVIMGLRPASALRRGALARQLLASLPPGPQAHWHARRAWIEGGLFHEDAVSVAFRGLLAALRALSSRDALHTMLHDLAPSARVAAFRRAVDRRWIGRALALADGRLNLFFPAAEWRASEYPRALTRDPRPYLEALIAGGLADNPLFAHVVRGRDAVLPPAVLPPHLEGGAYDGLRAHADRVRVVGGAERLRVAAPDASLGAAYLSNAVDYLDGRERAVLFADLRRALADDAPILVFSNEAYAKVPLELGFALDEARSREVVAQERARVYRRVEVYRAVPQAGARRLRVIECV